MSRRARRALRPFLLIAVAPLLLLGCVPKDAAFQWHRVTIAGRTQCLPVAYTLDAQQRGLQGVSRVQRPLVFAYSSPSTPSFWMKDTPAPLTGVWVDARGRVIGLWHGRPESTATHSPPRPVSAVIEYPAAAGVPAVGAVFAIGGSCPAQPGPL